MDVNGAGADVNKELLDSVGGISGWEGTLTKPEFASADRVHDWRNHVPEVVIWAWPRLSMDARIVAYVVAKKAADAEEWD